MDKSLSILFLFKFSFEHSNIVIIKSDLSKKVLEYNLS